MEADSRQAAEPAPEAQNGLRETIKTILIALLLATIFRSFAYEPFHIPSGSMKSTLYVGDYLFVSKSAYGYSRYSFPFGYPFFHGRIFDNHKPERGDIVVFRPPGEPDTDFIKRLVGLPGDRIQMRDGVLYINDQAVPKIYEDEWLDDEVSPPKTIKRYRETLPNGKSYDALDDTPDGEVDNTQVYTVPEGHYFMMGDNRDNSRDSRYTSPVGFVPAENLVGRAEIIIFSWKDWFSLRTERFFKIP